MTAERIAELRARWTNPPNPVVIELLDAMEKAEAERDNLADCWQKAEGALNDMEIAKNERIATLEAALEEARKAIDPFYRFACMRLALPPKNRLGDKAPLRDVLPGSWPIVADLNTLHAAHERIGRLTPEGKPDA